MSAAGGPVGSIIILVKPVEIAVLVAEFLGRSTAHGDPPRET
jgi:hypothetical protein